MLMERQPELDLLVRLAYMVESRVVQERYSPHAFRTVAMGADGSPTEEVDRVAEAQVLSFLEQEGLDWNVLSEELGYVHRGGKRVLVLDPVDGSFNLLRGLPLATVSLALGTERLGDVDVGVVHDLYGGKTFWAVKGRGAYLDGQRLHTRPRKEGQELFFLNLNNHSTDRVRALASKARRIRSLGSASLEIAMVAAGRGDIYFFESGMEGANLRVTDIAAARLILYEAGGGMAKADGDPLDLPLTLDVRSSVIAWGSEEFFREGQQLGYW